MQISEAWQWKDAALNTLGAIAAAAAAAARLFTLADCHYGNNSPGEKLGINFDGNRYPLLIMEKIAGQEPCVWPGEHCYKVPVQDHYRLRRHLHHYQHQHHNHHDASSDQGHCGFQDSRTCVNEKWLLSLVI